MNNASVVKNELGKASSGSEIRCGGASYRFLLMGAGYGTGNCGVAALASGTINALHEARAGARIDLLDYGRSPAHYDVKCSRRTVAVELINLRFSKNVFQPNNIGHLLFLAFLMRIVPIPGFRRTVLRRNAFLARIMDADEIGSLAGGDSFSDIYGKVRLLYVALPQLLILLLGKPLIVLPQTIGPFEGRLGRVIAGIILRGAARVFARDRESLELARHLGRGNELRFRMACDMAFMLEPRPFSMESERPIGDEARAAKVGLNVSGLLWHGGYTGDNMFRLGVDYRNLVRRLIMALTADGCVVTLVPHVFGEHAGAECDLAACREVIGELGADSRGLLKLAPPDLDHQQLKFLIGQCDFFAGSRMHACIAALSQGVPAVGLAYSRKFSGVFDTVGVGELVVDLRVESTEEAIGKTLLRLHERERFKQTLAEFAPLASASVLGVFSAVDGPAKEGYRKSSLAG